ncbi:MAG: hypothetical protein LW720_18355, partial [Pirellula sp.]|nr:hypothetical protein [Pirellula sp.]
ACLLASDLAPHRVPGTDLGCLFASIRPGAAPGAWHRFGARADGTVETITGTTIHPVWSVDRQEWVPLAELAQGEGLCCDTESLGLGFPSSLSPKACGLVLSVALSRVSQPVYNIEAYGEHFYQVGELGLVVHNVMGGQAFKAPIRGLTLKPKLLQKDLDHIIARNWATSGARAAGKLLDGTTGKNLLDMVNATVRRGASRANTNGRAGTIFELDFGRQIGTDIAGKIATK